MSCTVFYILICSAERSWKAYALNPSKMFRIQCSVFNFGNTIDVTGCPVSLVFVEC